MNALSKRAALSLAACLIANAGAHAQSGGHSGRGGGHSKGGAAPSSASSSPIPADTPLDKIEIVGVIRAIDPAAGRITIAYDAVDALSWPKGVMPFVVSKTALLEHRAVGEKVRFKLQSQQISDLEPF